MDKINPKGIHTNPTIPTLRPLYLHAEGENAAPLIRAVRQPHWIEAGHLDYRMDIKIDLSS